MATTRRLTAKVLWRSLVLLVLGGVEIAMGHGLFAVGGFVVLVLGCKKLFTS